MRDVKNLRVLVVDDDADYREVIAIEFELAGFAVTMAPDADAAAEILDTTRVDAVILDFLMPTEKRESHTGIDLIAHIDGLKARQPNQQAPVVVMLTGYGDLLPPGDYHSKCAGVFAKPVDRRALVEFVLKQLGIAR